MSIQRTHGKMQLVCDTCDEAVVRPNGTRPVYAQDEFDVMIEDAKDAGWVIQKNEKGEWEHTCFDCHMENN